MKCSGCGLENPPSASRCDCGQKLGAVPSVQEPRRGAVRIVWLLPLLGSFAAGIDLVNGLTVATGAPQQAAAAGIALALVVIPYCLARAVMGLAGRT